MALLNDIITAIQKTPLSPDGSLTLQPSTFDGDHFLGQWFSNFLQTETFTLGGAQVQLNNNVLTVSGSSAIWNFAALNLSLAFSADANENVNIAIAATYSASQTVPLIIMPWLEVSAISLAANFAQPGTITNFKFSCTLQAPGHAGVPVIINPATGTGWQIGIASSATPVVVSDVVALFGGSTLESFLPTVLINALDGLQVNQLLIVFDSQTKIVSSFETGFSTANGWNIAPVISLHPGLQVNLTMLNAANTANRTYTAKVLGSFALAGITIPISLNQSDLDPGTWTFNLQQEACILIPDFSSLLQLAGQDFYNSIPSGLRDLAAIDLDVLNVNFDAVNQVLKEISLTVQSNGTWAVLPGYFNIGSLQIVFDITNVNLPAQRDVTGTVNGEFGLGNSLFLDCSIVKNDSNPGWTITAALHAGQTLNITQLATALFENKITVPSGIPQIIFSTLTASVTPSEGVFTLNAITTAPTNLFGSFSINGFNLTISRAATAGNPITGSIAFPLAINSSTINLSATMSNAAGAGWQFTGTTSTLQLADLASALGITLPATDELDLSLKNSTLNYNTANQSFVLGAQSVSYGSAVFAAYEDGSNNRQYYFGMTVSGGVNLSNLPLVDKILPSGETLQLTQMQATISSVIITDPAAIAALNNLIGSAAPQVPAQGIPGLVEFAMAIDLGSTQIPVNLGFGGSASATLAVSNNAASKTATATAVATAPPTSAAPASTKWFDTQRSFGPLTVNRVGLKYSNNVVFVLLDASMVMGGMNVSVDGLSVGMNIKTFAPQFSIDGLGIDYNNGTVEIGGAFLKIDPPQTPATLEFAGGVVVKTANFSVMALGEYAQIPSGTSLFLFASVSASFGGPPFFFITGFCGGFGYNSSLTLPTVDQIDQFPFIADLSGPSQSNASPLQIMETISGQTGGTAWVTPAAGQMWAAIGIQFNTFGLINSTAMLAAVFGTDFKLALLGLSQASFPMDSPTTYAFIELELEATFAPSDGIISFCAILSPSSYVLDPACHLTGGFAMYYWFGNNPHAGDFVVTLGGYSNYFSPPSWYPQIPRLGFSWALDSNISISGGAYFAMTPSALMAGGSFAAVYQSGDLHAWFTAYADIIIWWNPFHFVADIGISIGASYKLNLLFTSTTVTVELGADLTLWGPPTGGTAHVHWWVISFTVNFGSGQSTGMKVQQWSDFIPVLPAATDAVKFTAIKGIASSQAPASSSLANAPHRMMATNVGDSQPQSWFVRGDKFQFSTTAAVPVTDLYIGSTSTTAVLKNADPLNIAPIQQTGLSSSHTVYLQRNGEEVSMSAWTWAVNTANVSKALWGTGNNQTLSAGDDQLVTGQYTGMIFTAPNSSIGFTPGNATLSNLGLDPLTPGTNPLKTGQAAAGPVPVQNNSIPQIAQISQQQQNRTGIASALQSLGITVTNDNPVALGADAGKIFPDDPMLLPALTAQLESDTLADPVVPSALLAYNFKTTPSPLQVSTNGGNQSQGTININVSNLTGAVSGITTPITCTSITFYFNIGTASTDLILPASSINCNVTAGNWNIANMGGGIFFATPKTPNDSIIVNNTIEFSFYDFIVNDSVGTSPVLIAEVTSGQSANTTLQFQKFLGNFYFDNFQAKKNTVNLGDSVVLTWNATTGYPLQLNWKTAGNVNQSQDVSNTETATIPDLEDSTTFYLSATIGANTQQLFFPVTVLGTSLSITAVPAPPMMNYGEQVTFTYTTTNIDYCLLLPAMGTQSLLAKGSVSFTPDLQHTSFNLLAYNNAFPSHDITSIIYPYQFNPGVINSFTASDGGQMYASGYITLSWDLGSLIQLSIDQGVGNVTGNSVAVEIYQDTTYTLTGQSATGPVSSLPLTVTIIPIATYLVGKTYGCSMGYFTFTDSVDVLMVFPSLGINMTQRWALTADPFLSFGPDGFAFFVFDTDTNTFLDGEVGIVPNATEIPTMSLQAAPSLTLNTPHHFMTMQQTASTPTPAIPSVLLDYSISTSPSPVQMSIAGIPPNMASVTIAVSFSGFGSVNCSGITFNISEGTDGSDFTNDDSIKCSSLTNNWQIIALGQGTFTATPKTPNDGIITAAGLSFTFFDIKVNTQPGTTFIYITEVTSAQTANTQLPVAKFLGEFYMDNFRAEPNSINVGGSTTLKWNSNGKATVLLTWGNNSQDVSTVETYVPTTVFTEPTYNFNLTATTVWNKQNISTYLTYPLTVNTPVMGPVLVNNINTNNPPPINMGDSITLSWSSQNADHCRLIPALGTSSLPATGSVSITPTFHNYQFTLVAYDANELTNNSSLPIDIQFNNGTITSFVASVQSIYPGGPVTLSWVLASALALSIDQGVGAVTGTSVTVYPTQTTTYTLSCQTAGGIITSQPVTVSMIPLATFLLGTQYNAAGYPLSISFAAGSAMTIYFSNQYIARTGPWSVSGNTITVTEDAGADIATFQFNPANNTITVISFDGYNGYVLSP